MNLTWAISEEADWAFAVVPAYANTTAMVAMQTHLNAVGELALDAVFANDESHSCVFLLTSDREQNGHAAAKGPYSNDINRAVERCGSTLGPLRVDQGLQFVEQQQGLLR